ncbi:uncharacterized protein LOC144884689 [Branchiostoma floridae x Branchiostoma japonicum]
MTELLLNSNSKNLLTMVHLNARSILPKIEELRFLASTMQFSILCVTETWLSSEIVDRDIELEGYQVYRKDRNRHGGGVMMYVSDSLYTTRRGDLENDEIESMWCDVTKANTNLLINCSYRSPSADDTFFDLFEIQIQKATDQAQAVKVILGDFNAKNSNWLNSNTTDNPGRQLDSIFMNHGLEQVLHEPTRGRNLLDLIATSHPVMCHQTGTLAPLGDSDHLATATALNLKANHHSGKRLVWLYSKANIETLHQHIATAPWDINHVFDSMDDIWDSWYNMFIAICKQHIPHKFVSTTRTAKPWINSNKEIKTAIRRKHRLHSRAKRLNTEVAWATYRRQRNLVTALTRRAESAYIEELVNDVETGNTRRFFTYAKSALGNTSTGIPALKVGSAILETPEEKANALNDYFINQTDLPARNDPAPTFHPTTVPGTVLDSVQLSVEESDFSVSLRDYGQCVYAHFAVRTRMTFAGHSHHTHSMGGLNASVEKAYVSTLLVILSLMRAA